MHVKTTLALIFTISLTAACRRDLAAEPTPAPKPLPPGLKMATFCGGCFWCMEPAFDAIAGVYATTSGYTGGPEKKPTYEQVSSGRTGHCEALQVRYDAKKVSFSRLLEVFWRNIDPLAKDRQFCDGGRQYRSAVFYGSTAEKKAIETSLARVKARFSGRMIYTEIRPAAPFYPAERYHQDFYKKNARRYKAYRRGCGRDARLKTLWGGGTRSAPR